MVENPATRATLWTVRAADFLPEPEPGFDFEGEFIPPVLDEDLLKALRNDPLGGVADVSAAIGLLDLVHDQPSRYGTDGSQSLVDPQIELAINTLAAARTPATPARSRGCSCGTAPTTTTDRPQATWTRTRYTLGGTVQVEGISVQGGPHNLLVNGMAQYAVAFLGLSG